jgi:hypothetical protein
MNEQEAIKLLKKGSRCVENCNDCGCHNDCELALAIAALEKQVPKKPILYCHDNEFNKDVYRCSVCNCDEGLFKGQLFCEGCGQKLDWSE